MKSILQIYDGTETVEVFLDKLIAMNMPRLRYRFGATKYQIILCSWFKVSGSEIVTTKIVEVFLFHWKNI